MRPPSPQLHAENTPKLKAESGRLTFDVFVMVVVALLFSIPFYCSIRCCIIRSRIMRHVIWLKTKCRTTANAKPLRRTSARSSAQSRPPRFSKSRNLVPPRFGAGASSLTSESLATSTCPSIGRSVCATWRCLLMATSSAQAPSAVPSQIHRVAKCKVKAIHDRCRHYRSVRNVCAANRIE